MNIYYLNHSGFLIDFDTTALIFDPITPIPNSMLRDHNIFFISHNHSDHFKRDIFNYPNSDFILSNDITAQQKDAIYVGPYEEGEIDGIKFRTFSSTDQGVSFLIKAFGKVIFFAGDLNWWAWDTKKRPHIIPEVEEKDYKDEIAKLKRYLDGERIDFAFVPVDPRLDTPNGELLAALYFIKELNPKFLIPMHFWGDYDVINRLLYSVPIGYQTKIGIITKPNQAVTFKSPI